MKITISERTASICAIETERKELWAQSAEVSEKQMHATANYASDMLRMSGEQAVILNKMAVLDAAIEKILRGEV